MSRPARTPTEVLKAALWMLENVGWIKKQSARYNLDGEITGFCASGAVSNVEAEYSMKHRARARLASVVPGKMDLVDFNDHPHTSKEQVIKLFKRALKKGAK